ncbi:hypothetical protein, partial [Legionella fairfieldensis]|uniref:hypothetical protein n=1 Tax=Legionella fairfieldensis TaxID=45064 RepID=UPI001A9478F9
CIILSHSRENGNLFSTYFITSLERRSPAFRGDDIILYYLSHSRENGNPFSAYLITLLERRAVCLRQTASRRTSRNFKT